MLPWLEPLHVACVALPTSCVASDGSTAGPFTSITIGNAMPEIAAVASRCRQIARRVRLDPDALADVQVALDEILSNAIRHAFPDGGSHPIVVCFRVHHCAFEVTIEYGGVPFDPADAPSPDRRSPLQLRRPGGLGIHFVRELMDDMHYCRIGDVNRVTLTRNFAHSTGAGFDGTA